MLESFYPLIHLVALMLGLTIFLPTRWVRWGSLWYAQGVLTEWPFLVFLIGFALAYLDPTSSWFLMAPLVSIAQRQEVLLRPSQPETKLSSFWTHLALTFSKNIIPFKFLRPQHQDLKLEGETLTHLYFPCIDAQQICIHIHGGAWTYGDAHQLTSIVDFFHQQKISVVSINYKKSYQALLPEISQSVEDTFLRITQHFGSNKNYIVYGRSAGAHLALILGIRHSEKIKRLIALYPATSFPVLAETATNNDILQSKTLLERLFGGPLLERSQEQKNQSPLALVSKDALPKTLLVHGVTDPVLSIQQSDLFYSKATELHLPVSYLRLSIGTHAFDAVWEGLSMHTFKKALRDFLGS